jgi:hypothetical protein
MEEKQCEMYKNELALNNEVIEERDNHTVIIERFLYASDDGDEDEEPIDNTQD